MKKIVCQKDDFSEWYNQVIQESGLSECSDVRGCMILKPYGYSLWENIKKILDEKIKSTGHKNAYFPMFIPKSYFSREASHVAGFAKECAIVTHSRLKEKDSDIIIDEDSHLEEELIVRPTSETMIWNSYKKWINSYRDLPLKLNQWCNVCRWEMRTRPFLRTSEFLWQEGHTAHSTREEAFEEVMQMLNVYYDFGKEYLAIPFIKGRKTENEKFAGAEETYTIEALMKDGKALQCGTSHLLGQHFSKAFDVKFLDKNNELKYVWGTSWGISTRLIGALIMTHGDDRGLILPPKIAPVQVVIIPIFKNEDEKNRIQEYLSNIIEVLKKENIRYELDLRDQFTPGYKFNEWEVKGVPLRIVVGEKDIVNSQLELVRRDNCEKINISKDDAVMRIIEMLNDIQDNLYKKALDFREKHTFMVDNYEDFKNKIKNKEGFVLANWDGTTETEKLIKEETQATIRCIPLENNCVGNNCVKDSCVENTYVENTCVDDNCVDGKCIKTGKHSSIKVLFAQNY